MPLDPQTQFLLQQMEAAGAPPLHTLPVPVAREVALMAPFPPGPAGPLARVEDSAIPGPAGDIPVRIYTPEGTGPFPILVFYHGGGFVICNLDTHDGICRSLASSVGCLTISVDYRLAPDHKFPAAPEDCLAALRWAAANGAEIGGDPARIAVAGDSAGANLATVVALLARDAGGPPLAGQLLFCPVTQHYDTGFPSYTENAEGYFLTRDTMTWFSDQYLRSASDVDDFRASPLRAADLGGLPPALVITAEYDPLRDEGEAYAQRLVVAGVPTTLTRYPGVIHDFVMMAGAIDLGQRGVDQAAAWLKEVFAH
jgi:acetyl esterase